MGAGFISRSVFGQKPKYIKLLMAIPFLPAPLIIPTFNLIQVPEFENSEGNKLEKLKKYFKTRWICRISPEELFHQ